MGARDERSVRAVPKTAMATLLAGVVLQLSFAVLRDAPASLQEQVPVAYGITQAPQTAYLPAAPDAATLRLAAFGEPATLSRLLMLWLQARDNPPGASVPFRALDYTRLTAWLSLALDLDPHSAYPLLAAARLYAEAPDADKSKQMLRFLHEQFLLAPNRRWPWLAHAVYVADHRLHDKPLALRYARALRLHVSAPAAPAWVRQMEIFIHEGLGDINSARRVIDELLADGGIARGGDEERFLLHQRRRLRTAARLEP